MTLFGWFGQGLSGIGQAELVWLNWGGLVWVGLRLDRLRWTGLDWSGLGCLGLEWAWMDGTGLSLYGLGWDWIRVASLLVLVSCNGLDSEELEREGACFA